MNTDRPLKVPDNAFPRNDAFVVDYILKYKKKEKKERWLQKLHGTLSCCSNNVILPDAEDVKSNIDSLQNITLADEYE